MLSWSRSRLVFGVVVLVVASVALVFSSMREKNLIFDLAVAVATYKNLVFVSHLPYPCSRGTHAVPYPGTNSESSRKEMRESTFDKVTTIARQQASLSFSVESISCF
jgi:hypothetical protein